MWRVLSDMISRQECELEEIAQEVQSRPKLGRLWLHPGMENPECLRKTAFHGQPGGYVLTRSSEDLYAGLMHTFMHAILVPVELVDPPDIEDLMAWNYDASSSWGVTISFAPLKLSSMSNEVFLNAS